MARITYNVKARQRYEQVPVIDPETGEQKQTPVISKHTGEQKTTRKGKPVFRKVYEFDKTRPLPPRKCEACGKLIEVGQRYKHVTPKSGPYGGHTRRRHMDCPTWRASELSSSKMSGVMAAQEAFSDFLGTDFETSDEVVEALQLTGEEVDQVADEYQESADNIESGFGHETSQSMELAERADVLRDWAQEIQSLVVNYEPRREDYDTDEAFQDDLESWRDEVRSDITIVEETPI